MDNVSNCCDEAGSVSTAGSSRWNPTKEQIEILEGLYKEGIRTPTAEQIQQITGRLMTYGHIEGKNVFYWFQNHKARQRQKEKQHSLALLNRYFHHRSCSIAPSTFPSPCPNAVICGQCFVPPSELGLHPKMHLPYGVKKRQWSDFTENLDPRYRWANNYMNLRNHFYDFTTLEVCNAITEDGDWDMIPPRTLDLFPLHPAGYVNRTGRDNIDVVAGSSEVIDCSYDQQKSELLQLSFGQQ